MAPACWAEKLVAIPDRPAMTGHSILLGQTKSTGTHTDAKMGRGRESERFPTPPLGVRDDYTSRTLKVMTLASMAAVTHARAMPRAGRIAIVQGEIALYSEPSADVNMY